MHAVQTCMTALCAAATVCQCQFGKAIEGTLLYLAKLSSKAEQQYGLTGWRFLDAQARQVMAAMWLSSHSLKLLGLLCPAIFAHVRRGFHNSTGSYCSEFA